MKAVVYSSKTGFSERYAQMIANKLSFPAYSLKDAKHSLAQGTEIIYVACVRANKIADFDKAQKLYNIAAVCAVGLFPKCSAVFDALRETNKPACPLFYLRGGVDYKRLGALDKLVLRMVREDAEKNAKPEDAELLDVLKNGGDFVSEENLAELIAFALLKGE